MPRTALLQRVLHNIFRQNGQLCHELTAKPLNTSCMLVHCSVSFSTCSPAQLLNPYKASKDELYVQVTRCLTGGILKDAVHNITFELDLEMMLDMLRDIAAAMAYLHSQHPPIAHQTLNSAKVSCFACCCALNIACKLLSTDSTAVRLRSGRPSLSSVHHGT